MDSAWVTLPSLSSCVPEPWSSVSSVGGSGGCAWVGGRSSVLSGLVWVPGGGRLVAVSIPMAGCSPIVCCWPVRAASEGVLCRD